MQLQPLSPLGRQLQTHCRTVPQVVHLHLFAPPSLASPTSHRGQADLMSVCLEGLVCGVPSDLGSCRLWWALRSGSSSHTAAHSLT